MKNNNSKIYNLVFICSLVVFSLSLCAKFYLSSSANIKNGKLQAMFLQRSELEKEVSRLSFVDSSLSSLSYVEERAKNLGFVEMKSRLLSLDPKAPVQVASLQVQ